MSSISLLARTRTPPPPSAVAMEALPLALDRILHPAVTLVISVTVVLLFGEIIPQAICTRYGLAVGYYTRSIVKFLIGITYIISWPVSSLLDIVLGHDNQARHIQGTTAFLVLLYIFFCFTLQLLFYSYKKGT